MGFQGRARAASLPALAWMVAIAAPAALRAQDAIEPSPPAADAALDLPLAVVAADNPYADVKRIDPAHSLRGLDVPLRLRSPALEQASADLWAKGAQPKNNLLARVDAAAIGAATIRVGEPGQPERSIELAEGQWRDLGDPRPQYQSKGAVFCGNGLKSAADARLFCLTDDDADGRFDAIALAMTERGATSPHNIGLVGPPARLATPLAYTRQAATTAQAIEWRNCGKDWDRPHFSVGTARAASPNRRLTPADIVLLQKAVRETGNVSAADQARLNDIVASHSGTRASPCRRGAIDTRYQGARTDELGEGSAVMAMGPLHFAVGRKADTTPVKILGLNDPQALYRFEGAELISLEEGSSPLQVQAATMARFDRNVLEATGAVQVAEAPVSPGGELVRFGFRHGYAGRLTRDVTIRTLLTSRSLKAGTLLYGFPAQSAMRSVMRYGGSVIRDDVIGPSDARAINTEIVWCVPVRDEVSELASRGKPDTVTVRWTASCLPKSMAGTHTILKAQTPAFAVTSLSYDAGTSSNDGDPPVEPVEQADFGAPLSQRVMLDSVLETSLLLKTETLLGDEIVDSRYLEAHLAGGRADIPLAGTTLVLARAGDAVSARLEGKAEAGKSALILPGNFGQLGVVDDKRADRLRKAARQP